MKISVPTVKGARDFYPQDMRIRNWLYEKMREVSQSFGFEEYDGPFLETIDLYAAKSGEELVKEQSFVFQDRGGDWITLRPELTPSLARMVAQRQNQLLFPLKWWSFGPMWRYERPQRGRSREFFQWNIDLIGTDTPESDAELVTIAAIFLKSVGLSPQEIKIKVNDRKLIDRELAKLDIPPETRPDVLRLIDRKDKLGPAKWKQMALDEIGLSEDQFQGVQLFLANDQAWKESQDLQRFFDAISLSEVEAYIEFAPEIVRGLQYYTGIVFEAWDQDGEFRAILGGGRYDNLVGDVGGDPVGGTGFAMGDMVISLVLEKFGHLPSESELAPRPVLVTVFDDSLFSESIKLANEIRSLGANVMCYPESTRLNKQFKYADRIGSPAVVVCGPDEYKNGVVTVKNLKTRQQQQVSRSELKAAIQDILDELSPS